MQVLVVYDIAIETTADSRRLRQVAKICEGYGTRVQLSVFECDIDQPTLRRLVHDLDKVIDRQRDSVGIYRLQSRPARTVHRLGRPAAFDQHGPYVL